MDGAGHFRIFFSVILPTIRQKLATLTVFAFMGSWNSFLWPLIVLRSNEKLTLPIGLQSLLTPYGNNYDVLLAGSVMSVIPIIIVFLLNQKAFINGLTVGNVKG